MRDKCTFCRIYDENSKQIIYDDEYFFASMDAFPVSPGHTEIIPVRHVESLLDLVEEEWKVLRPTISEVIKVIEETDFKKLYNYLLKNPINPSSESFCKKMLEHPDLGKKPDAYNFGINEGRAAGRTVDHLHVHIIPRYWGDVFDPRGGVRYVIPWMGSY